METDGSVATVLKFSGISASSKVGLLLSNVEIFWFKAFSFLSADGLSFSTVSGMIFGGSGSIGDSGTVLISALCFNPMSG